ncbi:GTP-binding protein [Georgenia alba]|uniref:GTP-binding protein n=1 Tax=Georgenia alba TaxID=2233858 RepID=A0ABW2Q857_9MICO
MSYLNLGIVAHVDAGKTSLTERLLVESGALDRAGAVDAGTTVTDTLELERERGITIRSAVVSFDVGDRTINLIDTPGHPDFIAEVDRALAVLDGVVLVVSAVEGVQAQTLVLMRALQRLAMPTLIFVNKVDRRGARSAEVVEEITRRLTPDAVPMARVEREGGRDAAVVRQPPGDADLEAYVVEGARAGTVHPVHLGSAVTGAGVPQLMAALTTHLPPAPGVETGPPSGVIFKVERDDGRRRLAYVRMRRGTLRVRDRVDVRGAPERVTGIRTFAGGGTTPARSVAAGQIAQLRGLDSVRVGDVVGAEDDPARPTSHLPHPPFTSVVDSAPERRGAVYAALTELAEQDPLIAVHVVEPRDDDPPAVTVALYGDVQREVLEETLRREYDLEVAFAPVTTAHVERLTGTGHAVEFNKVAPNEFLATVGLRVEPAPAGAGVTFALEVEPGAMPRAFFVAVEDTVRRSLGRGPHGWPVPDVVVTMTHSGYSPRQSHRHQKFNKAMSSTGADFRGLTPRVLATALAEAGTAVCEPIHTFTLEVPEDSLGPVSGAVVTLGGVPLQTRVDRAIAVVTGDLPARSITELQTRLPGLTRGEGYLMTEPDRFEPVRRQVLCRSRASSRV